MDPLSPWHSDVLRGGSNAGNGHRQRCGRGAAPAPAPARAGAGAGTGAPSRGAGRAVSPGPPGSAGLSRHSRGHGQKNKQLLTFLPLSSRCLERYRVASLLKTSFPTGLNPAFSIRCPLGSVMSRQGLGTDAQGNMLEPVHAFL